MRLYLQPLFAHISELNTLRALCDARDKASVRWLHFRGGQTRLMVPVTRFALLSDLPGRSLCAQRMGTPLRDRAASHPTVLTLPACEKGRGSPFEKVLGVKI